MPQFSIILFFALILISCQSSENTESLPSEVMQEAIAEEESPLLEINLVEAREEGSLEKAIPVEISFDAVFKRSKQYKAIPLKPYLKKLVQSQNLDTSNTEIIFLCKDGYNPSMPLSKVLNSEPFLAIKDMEAAAGQNWMDTLKGLWSPYYLVWTNHAMGDKGYTWPYGLKYLQFKASDAAYKAAIPADANQIAGFELYKEKCMKCHSVNKVGGVMGPEMNIPKNITEYWKRSDIIAFVSNPYSYRYNSKMPPVANLKKEELERIIDYLEYMKGQKIEAF